MDRREFVKGTALTVAGVALKPLNASVNSKREFVIENRQLAWRLATTANGIRSVGLENRMSAREFPLQVEDEFKLIFSAGTRIEIPWWDFCLTDGGSVVPEQERGLAQGFHQSTKGEGSWHPVRNLAGGHEGPHYDGYGWFRSEFRLTESAKEQEIIFALGGYDQQDWNEQWIYLNGEQIGHRTSAGRWRTPGRYVLGPSDRLYDSLRFGTGPQNLLAVRSRGYDLSFGGVPEKALDRVVFHPWLFDQFVSVGDPYLPVTKFELRDVVQDSRESIRFILQNPEQQISVTAHYELSGDTRRKWLEVKNSSSASRLLLDVEVDAYQIAGQQTEGGQGEPVFLENQAFFALEHPAAINQSSEGTIRLWHCPGRKIGPGETLISQASLVGVAPAGEILDHFHEYIKSRSPRLHGKKHISVYTCYGINNQWGGCSDGTDLEVLDSLAVVGSWQAKGVKFDYFTMDTGWPDNDGDLTEFTPTCYPDGPEKILSGVKALAMKFGLWFSVSGGGWSDGSYPPVQPSAIPDAGGSDEPPALPPVSSYRNGYPIGIGVGRDLCIASDPYFRVFKNAIQHHVRDNQVKLVKFDIGDYYCNSTLHNHLPGKYSSEAMFDRLIDVAQSARAISPDVFVLWYWGVGSSPFWGLYGDGIFESGLFLEGSGTSWVPNLYYRDSVTVALDQSTRFAKTIPPLLKDSLGVWLSQIRWANFMGKHRWREALVMDLGRGNLIFPQLWSDPNLLNDDDLRFLSGMMDLSRKNESIFMRPRRNFGDMWINEPYGYSFFDGDHGFIFCNNVHFASRSLKLPFGPALGMSAPAGTALQLTTHFPERMEVQPENGTSFRAGSTGEIWLRPFETLLLEVSRHSDSATDLPKRQLNSEAAAQHGFALDLHKADAVDWMELKFADAARFEKKGMRQGTQNFSCRLPIFEVRSILAIHIALKKGDAEFRYSPFVADLVQMRARLANHDLQFIPVPDARQYGNTQNAGCSWMVYKVPVSASHSEQELAFSIHTYLPEGVDATVAAWLVKQWWREDTRPEADGYYGDAPS